MHAHSTTPVMRGGSRQGISSSSMLELSTSDMLRISLEYLLYEKCLYDKRKSTIQCLLSRYMLSDLSDQVSRSSNTRDSYENG